MYDLECDDVHLFLARYLRLSEKANEREAAREMNHCSDFSEAFDK